VESWQGQAAGAISVIGKAVLTLYPPLRPLSHNVNPRDGAQDIQSIWRHRFWRAGRGLAKRERVSSIPGLRGCRRLLIHACPTTLLATQAGPQRSKQRGPWLCGVLQATGCCKSNYAAYIYRIRAVAGIGSACGPGAVTSTSMWPGKMFWWPRRWSVKILAYCLIPLRL
jgi:hypothetical protein